MSESALDVMAKAAFDCGRKYLKGEPTEYSNKATREMAEFQLAALAAAGYAVVPVEPVERKVDYATNEDASDPERTGCGWQWADGSWLDLELEYGWLRTSVNGTYRTWRDPIAACAYLAAMLDAAPKP